jgi:hypothetical protein
MINHNPIFHNMNLMELLLSEHFDLHTGVLYLVVDLLLLVDLFLDLGQLEPDLCVLEAQLVKVQLLHLKRLLFLSQNLDFGAVVGKLFLFLEFVDCRFVKDFYHLGFS